MQADTSMKLNVKGNVNTNEIAEVIRKALQSKATDDIETEAVNTFCDDMNISNNQVSVEGGWSITSWEFEYLKEKHLRRGAQKVIILRNEGSGVIHRLFHLTCLISL